MDRLKFQKFRKILSKTIRFSLAILACSPKVLTANTDSEKNNSFECSEIVESLTG